jgi:hypothetical protein
MPSTVVLKELFDSMQEWVRSKSAHMICIPGGNFFPFWKSPIIIDVKSNTTCIAAHLLHALHVANEKVPFWLFAYKIITLMEMGGRTRQWWRQWYNDDEGWWGQDGRSYSRKHSLHILEWWQWWGMGHDGRSHSGTHCAPGHSRNDNDEGRRKMGSILRDSLQILEWWWWWQQWPGMRHHGHSHSSATDGVIVCDERTASLSTTRSSLPTNPLFPLSTYLMMNGPLFIHQKYYPVICPYPPPLLLTVMWF